jgi:hypothetical protein
MHDKHAQDPGRLVDPHADRLLRDLIAVGLIEADNRLSANERLIAMLGPELHQAIRVELGHLDSSPMPLPGRPLRVA